jgi:hypothetical protein
VDGREYIQYWHVFKFWINPKLRCDVVRADLENGVSVPRIPYLPYDPAVDQGIINFHCAYLENLFRFLHTRGVTTREAMNRFNARRLISEALWNTSSASLLRDPKYNLRYYSQDAHEMALSLGRTSHQLTRSSTST